MLLIVLFAWCTEGIVGMRDGLLFHGVEDFGASGMFHRPFLVLRVPCMMIWPFLRMLRLYLLKMATQSSSQSCPMEMREPD